MSDSLMTENRPSNFVQNAWYVAAWDYEVGLETLLERTILGVSIVFYRSADLGIAALDNRCCHRQAPLSLGRREGDDIRCMYHGLKYNSRGECIEVPGQKAIPKALRIRSFPVIERGRWIWIWMGNPALANPSDIPATPGLDDTGWHYKPGYLTYAASHELITDNLLDFSHLSFVHESTLGGSGDIAATKPNLEVLTNGVRLTRKVTNTVPAPYHLRFAKFPGAVDRSFIYDYFVPGILVMQADVRPSATDDRLTVRGLSFRSCQAVTPETGRYTHYFFMQAHDFSLEDTTVTETLYQSVLAAFNEDRKIIEAQQALIDRSPPTQMVLLHMDSALAEFRKIMQKRLASAENPSALSSH